MKHFNLLDISMYQIQLFLAVAEEQNFSRAAELLNLTQPTLSKRIVALENTIGVPLFDRKQRPVALTEPGKVLYGQWKEIVRTFELSVEDCRSVYRQSIKKLNICLIDSSRHMRAMRAAGGQFEEEYPGVVYSWEYSPYNRWRQQLVSGNTDIMYTLTLETEMLDEGMEHEVIMRCPKLVCMLKTNPLSQRDAITYEDLREQKFVVNSPKAMPSHYEFIRKNTLRHGFEPQVARYTATTHDLIGSLKNSDEVVVCDVFLRDINTDYLKIFELPDTESGLLAIWMRDNPNPYIERYIEIAKECFVADPPTIP